MDMDHMYTRAFLPTLERAKLRRIRFHDLRHTFAVNTILDWYRNGLNSDREMIKLSTYLGHVTPECTYWYIEAVPELLQLASERAERFITAGGAQ